ncbi:MAG: hypothetical protein JNL49_14050 [Bacteroidia bacterium]|nr:hypothetical protein [Bacteroidia bacterium]
MKKFPLWWYLNLVFLLGICIYDWIDNNDSKQQFQFIYLNSEFHGIIDEIILSRGGFPTILVNDTNINLNVYGRDAVRYFEIGDSISKKKTEMDFVVYKMKNQKIVEFKIFKPNSDL